MVPEPLFVSLPNPCAHVSAGTEFCKHRVWHCACYDPQIVRPSFPLIKQWEMPWHFSNPFVLILSPSQMSLVLSLYPAFHHLFPECVIVNKKWWKLHYNLIFEILKKLIAMDSIYAYSAYAYSLYKLYNEYKDKKKSKFKSPLMLLSAEINRCNMPFFFCKKRHSWKQGWIQTWIFHLVSYYCKCLFVTLSSKTIL